VIGQLGSGKQGLAFDDILRDMKDNTTFRGQDGHDHSYLRFGRALNSLRIAWDYQLTFGSRSVA